VVAAMTRADKAANPRRDSSEKNWGPVVASVLVILGISWRLGHFSRMLQWYLARQAEKAKQELELRENTAQEPRRRNRSAQARARNQATRDREATAQRREQERRDRETAAREAREREAAAREAREREAAAEQEREQEREAAAEAARAALDREAAEAARAALDREAAAFWEWEARYSEAAAWAARATASEEKTEEPMGREESKHEPAAPEGYEIVARVLERLGEAQEVLPILLRGEVEDAFIPTMDLAELTGLGVSRTTAEKIIAAVSESAVTAPPRGKVLVDDDILDDAAARQEALETSLTARQAEVARLKEILKQQHREIPDAYVCPITVEVMEDPCIAADGNSYERREIQAWFARGKRTSPMTGAQLPHTHLTPNINLKKAIQNFLEEVRQFDCEL